MFLGFYRLKMLVSTRGGQDYARVLLVGALAAALLTSVRTQLAADELDRSIALLECFKTIKASVEANSSWQVIRAVDMGHSTSVQCTLNITIAAKDDPSAAPVHPLSSPRIERRLLFRIDQLHLQKQMEKEATSSVSLSSSLRAWSKPLCDSTADRYAWFNDSLVVLIVATSARPILRLNVSFVALPAINACEACRHGTVALAVESVVYLYAPEQFYSALLSSNSLCEMNRNYTVHARAADASRLLRVTVLAAPSETVAGCPRLHIERSKLVMDDLRSLDEPVQNVTIVYEQVGSCPSQLERDGFTLKLESVPSAKLCSTVESDSSSFPESSRQPPKLNGPTSAPGSGSPTLTSSAASSLTTLVATLVAVLVTVLAIIVIVVVSVRTLGRRDRQQRRSGVDARSESCSSRPGGTAEGRRGNTYPTIFSCCLPGNSFDSGSAVSVGEEMAMIDNDLYAAPRLENLA